MLGITRKQFITYTLTPGIQPRLRNLFGTGFQHIAFFMALVYQTLRLLPKDHPYASPSNIGRFGIRHVIAAAANNVVFSYRTIDQIILFLVILIGIAIALTQIILLALSFAGSAAMAATVAMPTNFAGFFVTERPDQDIAHMMLDLVFGIPEFFNSCVSTLGMCQNSHGGNVQDADGNWILSGSYNNLPWPFPIHNGLHQMFQTYSFGLLVVATLIFSYFIATVLLETAESGTPFGRRYNKVWAPLRMVMAFGLLIPVGYGLNSSQYIVLYAAKFGSAFATNGWNLFNEALSGGDETHAGEPNTLVAKPNPPEVGGLLQFMYVANVCFYGEWYNAGKPDFTDEANFVNLYAVRDNVSSPNYLKLEPEDLFSADDASYNALLDFLAGSKTAVIRIGKRNPNQYKSEMGNVEATCGEIILPIADPRKQADIPDDFEKQPDVAFMQKYYFKAIKELWFETLDATGSSGASGCGGHTESYPWNTVKRFVTKWEPDPLAALPPADYRSDLLQCYKDDLVWAIDQAIAEAKAPGGRWSINGPEMLLDRGWAGAGIWYNRIAEINGGLVSAAMNTPMPSKWPKVMAHVAAMNKQQNQDVNSETRFNPQLSNKQDVPGNRPEDPEFYRALSEAFNYWQADGGGATTHTMDTGNPVADFINKMFGTSGIFSMRKNGDVHPLAQIVALGRGLIEAGTRNLLGGGIATTMAGIFGGKGGEGVAKAILGIALTIVTIQLTIGFILFYIVPFLPFLYFFFAVGGWIKAIFEAMVGAPLWALAHIRIDGEGLSGRAALNGYFLIFEIFLRPIMIVFGFLASISIFGAMASVLNQTWDLVTSNLSGFDVETEVITGGGPTSLLEYFRGPVDEFFFTVIYTIVVYMMAVSSFKLIDAVPASILRWMGQSVQTENDAAERAGDNLLSTATVGAQQGAGTITGIAGDISGSLTKMFKPRG